MERKTIFIFAYYSFKDPVFQSAVLPYLKMVKQRELRFLLLTWEQKVYKLTSSEVSQFSKELQNDNILWHRTQWNSGKLKLIKKGYDFAKGLVLSLYLIIKYKAFKIYSEGFPGAVIGHYLSKITGRKHIVHTFEPHADYMRDAGVWTSKSWEYRLLKMLEIPIANHCEHIITATNAYKQILIERGAKTNIWTIPSCVDFDKYKFELLDRNRIRKELKANADQIVIVYMGKMGGMYMEEEIFDFFRHCLSMDDPYRFRFLLLTNTCKSVIKKYALQFDLPFDRLHIRFASKEEVPLYLSAADIAFCGVRPIPSRRFSSPIKNGEYWACGLPILIPKGIAEDDSLAEKHDIGKSFGSLSDINEEDILYLMNHNRTSIREKGKSLRAIRKYKENFLEIFMG